jgi:hypothetical protein
MLRHKRTSSKTEPNNHCNQATKRPEEFQIVIHSSKDLSVEFAKRTVPILAKLVVFTFDDQPRSVDRVMLPQ